MNAAKGAGGHSLQAGSGLKSGGFPLLRGGGEALQAEPGLASPSPQGLQDGRRQRGRVCWAARGEMVSNGGGLRLQVRMEFVAVEALLGAPDPHPCSRTQRDSELRMQLAAPWVLWGGGTRCPLRSPQPCAAQLPAGCLWGWAAAPLFHISAAWWPPWGSCWERFAHSTVQNGGSWQGAELHCRAVGLENT